MGTLKQSDLIAKLGYSGGPGTESGTLRIEYRSDGKVFDYEGVSFSIFRNLIRSKHPGQDWLKIRGQF